MSRTKKFLSSTRSFTSSLSLSVVAAIKQTNSPLRCRGFMHHPISPTNHLIILLSKSIQGEQQNLKWNNGGLVVFHGLALLEVFLLSSHKPVHNCMAWMEKVVVDCPEKQSSCENGFLKASEPCTEAEAPACNGKELELDVKESLSYANILLTRHKFVEAQAMYEGVLEKDKENVEAFIGKGICLQMQSLGRLAFECFSEALRRDPQNACALTHCGILYKDDGRLVDAAEKVSLNANEISDDSISWQGLTELKYLTYLSLNQNHLTSLPPSLGELTSLEELHVAGNKLESLPTEIGLLTQLQILKVNNNRISAVPSHIGDCSSLSQVDISANLLLELPETFVNLQNLKVLRLSNNGLKSLPTTLFKGCIWLSTLDLHGTEITMDMLREVKGWEVFDERRRLKYQKQLDYRVGGSAEFDEGADKKT